jgi:PAS domain S-box-containing protein
MDQPSTKRGAARSDPSRAPRLIMSGVAGAFVARARWLARMRAPSRAQWTAALATAIGYYAGAKIGFAFTASDQAISTLWPPNAILLAALLIAPISAWPYIFVALFPAHLAVNWETGVPLPMALCWFVSNSSEALIGALCIRRFTNGPVQFDSVRRVGIFVVFGAIVAPFLSSFLDVAFVKLNAWGGGAYWELWRTRFFSNVLAVLALVPVIVSWKHRAIRHIRDIPPLQALEAAVLASSLLVVCTAVFARPPSSGGTDPALLYAPLPLLLWAAVRFGPSGTSGSLLIVAMLSIWGAITGQGPFPHPTNLNVLAVQLFLILTSVPLLTLAAVIRERARVENDALRNQERLNLALSAAQIGTWELDIRNNCGTLSEKSKDILGFASGEVAIDRRRFADLAVDEDRPHVRDAFARAIQLGETCEVEFRTMRGDGDVHWVLSKGKIVEDPATLGTRMLGVLADITERRRADGARQDEAALRESEARFRQLADAMPQIVWTARPDGQIDYFNRKWYELTGTPPGVLTDDSMMRIVHPEDRAAAIESWAASVASRRPHEHEKRLWSVQTRSYRWHLNRALPVFDESGAVLRWCGTATDIDDHKRAEQALRDSEAKLRPFYEDLEHRVAERTVELSRANATLRAEIDVRVRAERALRATEERFAKAFRASPDAISIARLPECRVIEINERWEAMFGLSRSEAIGRTIDELRIYTHQADSDRLRELMASQGYVREFEMDMRNRAVEPLRAVLAAENIDVGGEPCLITLIRDITEKRRAEHEIVAQRRQLAHLGRVAVVGEMSGALAHELNQPLTAILANARAAQRMLLRDRVDVAELRAILDDVVADDLRAGAVIHRVRALIRKGDTGPQQILANEIVGEVLELAHSDLIQREVRVSTRLAPSLPSVPGDRVQLQQVVLNLIVNACDAMADNSPGERTLAISTSDEGTSVRISVSDRGTGIAGDSVESVFEPFVTSKEHGLGLGLAICRSIVNAHGGRMWAVNNPERGATFHLLLPQAPIPALDVAISPAESLGVARRQDIRTLV